MLHAIVYNLLFGGAIGYALLLGGAPERVVALLFVAARLLTRWAASSLHGRFDELELGIFLVDLGLFAALYLVSLLSARFWPIWMSGIQGAAVLAHSVILMKPTSGFAYVIMMALWTYLTLALLAAATWRHRSRLRSFGSDRPWVGFSRRSGSETPR